MSIVTRMGKKSVLHYLYSRNMDDLELNVLTWMNLTNIILSKKEKKSKIQNNAQHMILFK